MIDFCDNKLLRRNIGTYSTYIYARHRCKEEGRKKKVSYFLVEDSDEWEICNQL